MKCVDSSVPGEGAKLLNVADVRICEEDALTIDGHTRRMSELTDRIFNATGGGFYPR
jgi:hypothetical protein